MDLQQKIADKFAIMAAIAVEFDMSSKFGSMV